jgi:DNA-binding response OmpR family regulator
VDTRLNIVVIEDNDDLREATVDALRGRGHQVLGLGCAEALPEESPWQRIDILVVDLNLPGEDGLSLAARARALQPDVGIIMVTARGLPTDKLAGYETGADIYMTKPVSLEELSAAIRSLSRRLRTGSTAAPRLTLDLARSTLRCADQSEVRLSGQECAFLAALARASDQRLETWQLIDILDKGSAEDPKAALEICIARLRKKLLQSSCTELAIKSLRNWGYQLQADVQLA